MTTKNTPSQETIGNYDLLEKVGEGCMGTVYKARHWQTKEIVAIKVMNADVCKNPVLLKRFEQEFRIASKLDHPNVVKVLEFCGQEPQPFLVMEYVDGESLGDKLEREGRMPEEDAVRVIIQVAHGLHRAHRQGLIHRDVKPDNILVAHDGKAKITDLGLAKDTDAGADLTRTGRGLGTPTFMAPEQFRNAKNASIRCDVYGLGATLYQMVTGRYPFDEEDPVQAMMKKLRNEFPPPSDIIKGLSERTDWTIRRAMSADPEQRPESCREFAEDLIGQSTRRGSRPDIQAESGDIWYMVFTDEDGVVRTAKGTNRAIQKSLREGKLGDPEKVRGSRSTVGPFEPLHNFPEFRDLVVGPAPGPPLSEMSMANLSRLNRGRLDDGGRRLEDEGGDEAPPERGEVNSSTPHFQLPGGGRAEEPAAPSRVTTWVTMIVLLVVAVVTTFLASRYLFPLK
jgi:serine/threonine protein kinase